MKLRPPVPIPWLNEPKPKPKAKPKPINDWADERREFQRALAGWGYL